MIPEFPKFKNLELSDKKDVEVFTSKFPPYSDFNFVSMWSWDIKGEMRLSQLNGNLVVLFTDYLTSKPFYTFLGNNKVNETTNALLNFSIKEELQPKLYLLPQEVALQLDKNQFRVEEDPDNFDYIFDLNEISRYAGTKFVKKRNKINQFIKKFPTIKMQAIDISDESIKEKILQLDEFWLKNKTLKDSNFKIKNELLATTRFFQLNWKDTFDVGIFSGNKMIGYSIFSIVPNNYAISHFTKADTSFLGIYDFLMKESAKMLIEKNCLLLNHEQDLGLPGLRESKKSFMSKYLKKYMVGFAH